MTDGKNSLDPEKMRFGSVADFDPSCLEMLLRIELDTGQDRISVIYGLSK